VYLLVFSRRNSFSVLFDTMGTGANGSYLSAFVTAAIIGLVLYYGFEACVRSPRRLPIRVGRFLGR